MVKSMELVGPVCNASSAAMFAFHVLKMVFRRHLTAKLRTSQPENALDEPSGFRCFASPSIGIFSAKLSSLELWPGSGSSLFLMCSCSFLSDRDITIICEMNFRELVTKVCKVICRNERTSCLLIRIYADPFNA